MSNSLKKEIFIKATVSEVYDCFTKEEAMLTWHGKEVELNPVPGGVYKVVFEDGTIILGKYLEVVPNKRVVYTAKYGNVDSLIEIKFKEESDGTRIILNQEFSPGQDTSSFNYGWDYFLGLLVDLLEK